MGNDREMVINDKQKNGEHVKESKGEIGFWKLISAIFAYLEMVIWLGADALLLIALHEHGIDIGLDEPAYRNTNVLTYVITLVPLLSAFLIVFLWYSRPKRRDKMGQNSMVIMAIGAGIAIVLFWLLIELLASFKLNLMSIATTIIALLFVLPNFKAWTYFYSRGSVRALISSTTMSLTFISIGIAISSPVIGMYLQPCT